MRTIRAGERFPSQIPHPPLIGLNLFNLLNEERERERERVFFSPSYPPFAAPPPSLRRVNSVLSLHRYSSSLLLSFSSISKVREKARRRPVPTSSPSPSGSQALNRVARSALLFSPLSELSFELFSRLGPPPWTGLPLGSPVYWRFSLRMMP